MKRTAEEPGGPPLEIQVSPLAAWDDGLSDKGQQPNLLILVTAGRIDVTCAKCISSEHLVGKRLEEVLRKPLPYWVWRSLVYFPIPLSNRLTFADGGMLQPAGCVA